VKIMFIAVVSLTAWCGAFAAEPWPAPVKDFKPSASGEHPRLFFRKADLPALKARAATPEGKQIIARLRILLNGSDGESMPTTFNPAREDKEGSGEFHYKTGIGAYTLWHGAGYGMLYQLTGDKKYEYKTGDLAKQVTVKLDDKTVTVLTFSENGQHPEPKSEGNAVKIGNQTFTLGENGKLALAVFK